MPSSPPDHQGDAAGGGFDNPAAIAHQQWLAAERARLWDFGRGAVVPEGGFGWLDDAGRVDASRPVEAWVTCRMTHVAALEALAGNSGAVPLLDHGVRALETTLHDPEHEGWYAAVGPGGPVTADKRAYEHAFVLLAAASALTAGHPRAGTLLDACAAGLRRALLVRRGAHGCRRLGPALVVPRGLPRGQRQHAQRRGAARRLRRHRLPRLAGPARSITERLVHGMARSHQWLLPEHFTPDWVPVPDYNRDDPAHPFRPYGATVGHLLEWSRLTLHLRTALGPAAEPWMLDDARSLFEAAVRVGWGVDGAEGFVYTTDFSGAPVVRTRLHWVVAEGIAAAYALWAATGEEQYQRWYAVWWAYAQRFLIDREGGSWRHELDQGNRPSHTVWQGRPDVYHAYQAALLPSLGEITSFAGALARRRP